MKPKMRSNAKSLPQGNSAAAHHALPGCARERLLQAIAIAEP
jgi:hypothetical protein